ncbi:MAG: serine protease [Actinobacteria bacterium]|nr:MAG: serine protease [Actinomycetota bacterium]
MRVLGGVLAGLALALGTAAPAVAVVGGQPAANQQFPWVVRLSVGCDGALVAPRVVLTAAHCVDHGPAVTVRAGSADLRGAVTARATAGLTAPGHRPGSVRADWAVLRLDRRVNLPVLRLGASPAEDQGPFTVVGWGATREHGRQQRYLRFAAVPAVPDQACAAVYASFAASDMLCAGNLRGGGVDTCDGDSGGPMLRADGTGGWVEAGIVSWGVGCARPGYPGVYTRVSSFVGQITAAVTALD